MVAEHEALFREVRRNKSAPCAASPIGVARTAATSRPPLGHNTSVSAMLLTLSPAVEKHVAAKAPNAPLKPAPAPMLSSEKMTMDDRTVVPAMAASDPLVFGHHETLPDFMHKIMEELNTTHHRVDQLESPLAEIPQLKGKLAAVEAMIAVMQLQLDAQSKDQTGLPVRVPVTALTVIVASKYATTDPTTEDSTASTPFTWADRLQTSFAVPTKKHKKPLTPCSAAVISHIFV